MIHPDIDAVRKIGGECNPQLLFHRPGTVANPFVREDCKPLPFKWLWQGDFCTPRHVIRGHTAQGFAILSASLLLAGRGFGRHPVVGVVAVKTWHNST